MLSVSRLRCVSRRSRKLGGRVILKLPHSHRATARATRAAHAARHTIDRTGRDDARRSTRRDTAVTAYLYSAKIRTDIQCESQSGTTSSSGVSRHRVNPSVHQIPKASRARYGRTSICLFITAESSHPSLPPAAVRPLSRRRYAPPAGRPAASSCPCRTCGRQLDVADRALRAVRAVAGRPRRRGQTRGVEGGRAVGLLLLL